MRRETKKSIKELSIHSGLTWQIFFPGMKCNRGEGTEILQISANVVSLSYIHESYQKWERFKEEMFIFKMYQISKKFHGSKMDFHSETVHAGRGQYPLK